MSSVARTALTPSSPITPAATGIARSAKGRRQRSGWPNARQSCLHELMPSAARIALLVNPANPVPAETITKDTEAAAETIGRHIDVYKAETSREIEMAFAALVRDRADALLVG